jgi:hypothetical protein
LGTSAEQSSSSGSPKPIQTTIPGIRAKHAVISNTCRETHGNLGALEEAFRRVREEYLGILMNRGSEKGLNFHVVLTLEDEKRKATT